MFLIHFLGDIHQPLHTELAYQGGNKLMVDFDGHRERLHATWDSSILLKYRGLPDDLHKNEPKEKRAAAKWADELYDSEPDKDLQDCKREPECDDISNAQTCALRWASEANCRICTHVLTPTISWLQNNDLGGDYYKDAAPIVVDLMKKAGLRLGAWINALGAIQPAEEYLVIQDVGKSGESLQDLEL